MRMTTRDYEILRTLVRVQFATTATLQRGFFGNLRVARRRLLTLRNYGFIIPHAKGLPGNYAKEGGLYWRLTDFGLDTFSTRFPKERIPANHVRRSTNASLRFFDHRSEITRLYMKIIESKDLHVGDIRTRADMVDWYGEHEVLLTYKTLTGVKFNSHKIVPDATLVTKDARIFIEVDRSTESAAYCKRTLASYASAMRLNDYAEQFPGDLPAFVLYSTQSQSRTKGLREVINDAGELPYTALSMHRDEAAKWLVNAVTEAPNAGGEELSCACKKTLTLLRALYNETNIADQENARAGIEPRAHPALEAAYNYLTKESARG